jgi:hypothetical protein
MRIADSAPSEKGFQIRKPEVASRKWRQLRAGGEFVILNEVKDQGVSPPLVDMGADPSLRSG